MQLLSAIEQHLDRAAIPATRFGREVVNDPRFVLDLRLGRRPRAGTAARVWAHLRATGP